MKLKKFFISLLTSVVLASAAFAETGFNIETSLGLQATIIGKPYAFGDISFNYEFDNGWGVGGGVRSSYNIINYGSEAPVFFFPYVQGIYEVVDMSFGLILSKNEFSEGFIFNPYIQAGVSLPVWEFNHTALGFNLGMEFWFDVVSVNSGSGDAGQGFADGLATIFLTILNPIKYYVGLKYFINI